MFGFRVTPPDKIKSISKSHAKLEEMQTGFQQKVFTWKYNVELAKHQPVLLAPSWIFVQFFAECMRIGGEMCILEISAKKEHLHMPVMSHLYTVKS